MTDPRYVPVGELESVRTGLARGMDPGVARAQAVAELDTLISKATPPPPDPRLLAAAEVVEQDYGQGVDNGYWPTLAPVVRGIREVTGKETPEWSALRRSDT